VCADRLAVQFGGAAGTLAALGPAGLDVVAALADELDLAAPVLPWHTDRTRIADIAGALGIVAGAIGKVARDVTLHAQTEVGEVSDAVDRGGSSTLPHKRNPVAAIAAAAGAAQAPGLVATLLAAMPQEYQRAAGAWHAEWRPLRALLESTGSAAHWLRDCLETLRVDADRMRANLDLTGGALLAERASAALAADLGATAAHDLMRSAVASGRPIAEVLGDSVDPGLFDPVTYLGAAEPLVDRALVGRGRAVRLHHVVEGPPDGAALVLLNSLGSDVRIWDALMPALTARWRVIRVDTRGHGGSPVPPGPYTVDDLGADVLGVLDRLGVATAHVCGVSLGGIVGMWLAATAPARVDRLVLCGTGAKLSPTDAWLDRARAVRAHGTAAVVDAVVERWFTAGYARRCPDRVAAAWEMIAATPAEGYAACCDAIARADLRPRLGAIVAPTLVIAGAEDPATPPSFGAAVASAVAGARLVVLPDAAHLAMLEQPDAVTALLLEHLT
jgi:3-oxoadipate enol-lactonase